MPLKLLTLVPAACFLRSTCGASRSLLSAHACLLTPVCSYLSLLMPVCPRLACLLTPVCSRLAAYACLLTPSCLRLSAHACLLMPACSHLSAHACLLTPACSRLPAHACLLTPACSRLSVHALLPRLSPHACLLTPVWSHLQPAPFCLPTLLPHTFTACTRCSRRLLTLCLSLASLQFLAKHVHRVVPIAHLSRAMLHHTSNKYVHLVSELW